MSGWVKIHRKIAGNGLWERKPFSWGHAWIDLIMLASHKDTTLWKRGIEIKQKRGQVAISIKGLADRWGWSRTQVRSFLEYLKSRHMARHQNNNVTTLITIENYDQYQEQEHQTGHQKDTIKNVEEVIHYLNSVTGKKFNPLSKASKSHISARLGEGYRIEDFMRAIDNQWSAWRGTDMEQYMRPQTLFNSEKFDGYVNNTKSGGKGYID